MHRTYTKHNKLMKCFLSLTLGILTPTKNLIYSKTLDCTTLAQIKSLPIYPAAKKILLCLVRLNQKNYEVIFVHKGFQ